MKNTPLFKYHLIAFVVGSLGIAAYFFQKISALYGAAQLASVVLFVTLIVYIIAFGLICGVSYILFKVAVQRKIKKNYHE